jgi:hypothetical protein
MPRPEKDRGSPWLTGINSAQLANAAPWRFWQSARVARQLVPRCPTELGHWLVTVGRNFCWIVIFHSDLVLSEKQIFAANRAAARPN